MSGSIKGITLEIGGNTTKLTQALKAPQKETIALRSKLKDVNSALKLDTKNVDLLNQKQRLVTQSIDSTEAELKLLKEAQRQYIESGKDLDSTEYIELEKKIAVVSRSLERLQEQQNNFNGEVQAMGLKLTEFGDKTTDLGKKFLPVTAGVTAVGAAAGAAWAELDEAYDGIAAGTGATGEALEALQASFDNVYGSFPASSADVSTAIADINTRFGLTGDALEQASTQFLKYAQVNNTDVSGSIENVAKAMYDAGIPTEELGTVLDKLTVASQASGLPVDQLSEALSKNGVNMRELGFSTDETIALLTTFEKSGVDASTVLTGMKGAVKNCAKEGKDAKTEMANMFEAIKNGSATAADAQELFGSKAGTALYNYAKEGKLNIEDMMSALDGSAGGLDATFEAMQDPADDMTVALNNLKLAGADLGDAIQSVLAPMIEKIADACKRAAEWFGSLSDEQKETVVKLGLVAAAIGPVLIAVGKISSGLGSLIGYFGNVSTVGGKVLSFFTGLTGSTGLAIGAMAGIAAAIGAVIGAFVHLWTSNEEFRNKMIEIWNKIVSKVREFCQGIVDRINSLGFEFENITEVIRAVWEGFCEFLAPIFEGIWNNISVILSSALDTIMGIVDFFISLFKGDWRGCWEAIKSIVSGIWEGIVGVFQNVLNTLKGALDVVLGWFGTSWEECWGNISTFFTDIWNGISETFSNVWNGITSFVTEVWNNISSTCSNIWNGIVQFFGTLLSGLVNTFSTIWNNIWNFLSGLWNGISTTCSDVWNNISAFIGDLLNNISTTFSDIWNNISTFLSDLWNGIKQTASDLWNGIKDTITDAINNAKQKLSDIWNNIKQTATDTWNNIKTAVTKPIDEAKQKLSDAWNGIKQTASDTWNGIKTTCSNVWNGIKGAITTPINDAKNKVKEIIDNIKGFFKFTFKWPRIPLPHFAIKPPGWKIGDLLKGSIPSLGINWYAKAMNAGMILTRPTIFGMQDGNLLAGGEAGAEAVVGVSSLRQMIMSAVNASAARFMPASSSGSVVVNTAIDYDRLADAMVASLSGVQLQSTVNVGGQRVADEILPLIDRGLTKRSKRR